MPQQEFDLVSRPLHLPEDGEIMKLDHRLADDKIDDVEHPGRVDQVVGELGQ